MPCPRRCWLAVGRTKMFWLLSRDPLTAWPQGGRRIHRGVSLKFLNKKLPAVCSFLHLLSVHFHSTRRCRWTDQVEGPGSEWRRNAQPPLKEIITKWQHDICTHHLFFAMLFGCYDVAEMLCVELESWMLLRRTAMALAGLQLIHLKGRKKHRMIAKKIKKGMEAEQAA